MLVQVWSPNPSGFRCSCGCFWGGILVILCGVYCGISIVMIIKYNSCQLDRNPNYGYIRNITNTTSNFKKICYDTINYPDFSYCQNINCSFISCNFSVSEVVKLPRCCQTDFYGIFIVSTLYLLDNSNCKENLIIIWIVTVISGACLIFGGFIVICCHKCCSSNKQENFSGCCNCCCSDPDPDCCGSRERRNLEYQNNRNKYMGV